MTKTNRRKGTGRWEARRMGKGKRQEENIKSCQTITGKPNGGEDDG